MTASLVYHSSYRYLKPFMIYRALKRWKSDTQAHTDTSGRQIKITYLDVLDYSGYLDTNIWKKKFHEIVFIDIIHEGTLIKNLLDLWYLVWSLTSCASKSTSFRHWCTLYILYSVNWIADMKSVFFYRKLSVDCESWAIDR